MERKKCPYCGEEIAATAKKCRFCGEWLEDVAPTQSAAPSSASQQPVQQPIQQPVYQQPVQQAAPQQPLQQPVQQPVYQQPVQQAAYQQPVQQPAYQQPVQQPVYQQPVQQPIYAQTESQPEMEAEPASPGFFQTYLIDAFFKHYADFSGVTSRKEFWLSYVALSIVSFGFAGLCMLIMGLGGMTGIIVAGILYGILCLGILVPGLAIMVRRLRDAGSSPWLILLSLIPFIGQIIVIVLLCRASVYEHEETESGFNVLDSVVTGASVVLLIVGSWLGMKGMASAFGGGAGDYDEYDTEVVEEVLEDDDFIGESEEVIEGDRPYVRDASGVTYFNTPGKHRLAGNFAYRGQEFPVAIDYNVDNAGEITSVTYYNISQDVNIPLNCDGGYYINPKGLNFVIFSGYADGTEFTITLDYDSDDNKLKGYAESGGSSLEAEFEMAY